MHSSRGRLRNVEYSILLVMSELSTVRCDRALGLWIAGTRASSVDGELPWRSSGRAAAVASTPGSRAQAATDAKSWRHGRRRRLGPRCGRGGDGRRAASRAVRRPRREWRLGPRCGGGNLPAREVLAVFSKPATYPGFTDSPKTVNWIFIDMVASRRRLRFEERPSAVG